MKLLDKPEGMVEQVASYAGRMRIPPVKIDLEDSIVMFFKHGVDRFPAQIDVDLEYEGKIYRLFGVFPIEHVEGSVWICNVDLYKVSP